MTDFEYVTLDEQWLARAKQYGTERNRLNGGNDTPAYKDTVGKLPYTSLTASRLAVVAEVAACFYFGVDPNTVTFVVDRTDAGYAALRANADLTVGGYLIEVRNSTHPGRPLPIKAKDVTAKALVVQAHVEMKDGRPTGRVYFLGWRDSKAYRPEHARNDTDFRYAKKPMPELRKVIGLV